MLGRDLSVCKRRELFGVVVGVPRVRWLTETRAPVLRWRRTRRKQVNVEEHGSERKHAVRWRSRRRLALSHSACPDVRGMWAWRLAKKTRACAGGGPAVDQLRLVAVSRGVMRCSRCSMLCREGCELVGLVFGKISSRQVSLTKLNVIDLLGALALLIARELGRGWSCSRFPAAAPARCPPANAISRRIRLFGKKNCICRKVRHAAAGEQRAPACMSCSRFPAASPARCPPAPARRARLVAARRCCSCALAAPALLLRVAAENGEYKYIHIHTPA